MNIFDDNLLQSLRGMAIELCNILDNFITQLQGEQTFRRSVVITACLHSNLLAEITTLSDTFKILVNFEYANQQNDKSWHCMFCFLCFFLSFFSKILLERDRRKQREKKKFSICWFTPPMPAPARVHQAEARSLEFHPWILCGYRAPST